MTIASGLADKNRDRDRAGSSSAGISSAALVARYLVAVFSAFVLLDALVTAVVPRYTLALCEEGSGAAAERQCDFGMQARVVQPYVQPRMVL